MFTNFTQGLTKLYCVLSNRAGLNELKNALEELYKKNNFEFIGRDGNPVQMCGEHSVRIIKSLLAIYCLTSGVFIGWSFVEYFWTGVLLPPLPARIPGIDVSTRQGYLVLAGFQSIMSAMAGCGLAFIDGTYTVFTFNILAFSGLIKFQTRILNSMLVDANYSHTSIRIQFRNIILMHKEMYE